VTSADEQFMMNQEQFEQEDKENAHSDTLPSRQAQMSIALRHSLDRSLRQQGVPYMFSHSVSSS
jgi:hypothetical protein